MILLMAAGVGMGVGGDEAPQATPTLPLVGVGQ
jgi:hypothetical protein